MRYIAVIESEEHLSALYNSQIPIADINFYCSNTPTCSRLASENLCVKKITDDFLSVDEINRIHIWTREVALGWFEDRELKPLLEYRDVNFGNIVLSDFRHALLQATQNYCIMKKIISSEDNLTSQFIIFFEKKSKQHSYFYEIENRSTVNHLLKLYSKDFNLTVCPLVCSNEEKQKSKKQMIFNTIKELLGFWDMSVSAKPIQKKSLLVCGGLNHLDEFSPYFKKMKIPFVLMTEKYNRNQLINARQLGVPYRSERAGCGFIKKVFLEYHWKRFLKKVQPLPKRLSQCKIFYFENNNLIPTIQPLFRGCKKEIKRRFYAIHCMEHFIRKNKSMGILLDEDTSFKRVYAAIFRAMKKPVFVVSHGVAGANFKINSDIKSATYGEYFVNSKFEYEQYRDIGWDPGKLHIVGVPRYDKIHKMRLIPKTISDRRVILYCPHQLTEKCTRALAYSSSGYETRQNTNYLIEAINGISHIIVWIKPHGDSGDIPEWKGFEQRNPGKVKVFSPTSNIFDLLHTADLLVTTFSSVVIEGLLFDMPVITLNFTGRPDFRPYASYGVTKGVYDPAKLREAIENCLYNERVRDDLKKAKEKYFQYFCGFCDGKNTERAIQIIMNKCQAEK